MRLFVAIVKQLPFQSTGAKNFDHFRKRIPFEYPSSFWVVIALGHPHLQISGKFLPTAFERRSQKMTTAPNLKPDSVSSESTKPASDTPQHGAPKTPDSQPHAEPKPAQKS